MVKPLNDKHIKGRNHLMMKPLDDETTK